MSKNIEGDSSFQFWNKIFNILYFLIIGLVIFLVVFTGTGADGTIKLLFAASVIYLVVKVLCTDMFYDKFVDPVLSKKNGGN
jgi:NhaP-type Na+/H+ or K+/H+ antiporter